MKKDNLFLPLLASAAVILLVIFNLSGPSKKQVVNSSLSTVQSSETNNQAVGVLGWGSSGRQPQIYVSGSEYGYNMGGLISLSSTAEPAVTINTYGISGTAEISIYEANEEAIYEYLLHDKDNKQINKSIDANKYRFIQTINSQIGSGETKVTLPIGEKGVWFLKLKLGDKGANALIIRSGFGVLAKEGDNEFIFWGQDYKTKRGIAAGEIKTYNLVDTKKELSATSFDAEGIARLAISAQADIAVAKKDDETVIVPLNLKYLNEGYNWQSYIPRTRETKYFTFTDRPIYKPGDLVYFKSIMRDDNDARYTLPTGEALVKIYNGWQEQDLIFQKRYPVSSEGTINGEYNLDSGAKTGYYRMVVSLPGSTTSETGFTVEYYRKPEYSIDINSSVSELVSGDILNLSINGSYFSGQPLNGQSVKYKLISGDFYSYDYYGDYSYQLSDDFRYGYWYGTTISENQVTFDNNGEAKITLDTKLPLGSNKNQVYTIEAEFDDGSGNPSYSRKNVLVFAAEYDIFRTDWNYWSKTGSQLSLPVKLVSHRNGNVSGIGLTAKVKRTTWIPYQDQSSKYPLYKEEKEDLPEIKIVTDSDGKAIFNFVPQKSGSYEITVSGSDTRGNSISKLFYYYVSSDENNYYYSGTGTSYLTVQANKKKLAPTESVTLNFTSVIPDRDVFLSFERAAVHRFQIVHLNGKTGKVEVPLVNTDMPDIYAKASSFGDDWLDEGVAELEVSTETKKLVISVIPDKKTYGPSDTVTVNVETKDTAGNPVSADVGLWAVDKAIFEVSYDKPAKIFDTYWSWRYNNTQQSHSLEGIIVLSAEMGGGCFDASTPVLMADGSPKKISEVKVGDSILTRESKESVKLVSAKVTKVHETTEPGYLVINTDLRITPNHILWVNGAWREASNIQIGDLLVNQAGENVLVNSIEWVTGKFSVYNLQIEKYQTFFAGGIWVHNEKGAGTRTTFKDTAYWNPVVHTDANGRARVTFQVPDNLTTWVISAIGNTADTMVGQNTSEVVVTKDIIVRPVLPNIFREGDEAIISAIVQNFTDQDHIFNISLKYDGGEVENSQKSNVAIKSKEMQQVYWKIFPKTENPKAKLAFSAVAVDDKKLTDTIVQEIPVRAFGFEEKRAENGDGPKTFNLKLSKEINKDKSNVVLTLSPTILGTFPSAMEYLIGYPYGCVEQTTSRFVPSIIAKTNPDLFGQFMENKDINDMISKGIARLNYLQQSDGGWSWWGSGNSSPFITSYVVEYLLMAKNAGFVIDPAMLTKAEDFMKNPSQNILPEDIISRNYALTLLNSNSKKIKVGEPYDLSPDILSMAVISNYLNGDKNPQTNGLSKLIGMAKTEGDSIYWDSGTKDRFGSVNASTAFAVRAILTAGGDREIAVKAARYLTKNRTQDYWSNTFGTVQVVRALVDLSKTGNELNPNYSYSIYLDNQEIAKGSVTDAKQVIKQIVVPLTKIKTDGSSLQISKNGEGQIYSTLGITEFHTDRNAGPVNRGLEISREYVSEKGPNYTLAVGDMVTVRLTVKGLNTENYYGVIADQLPAGLIPINESAKNQQYNDNETYRYYYDSYDITDKEYTENGVVLSLYRFPAGEKTFTYKARVISEGTFIVPPATAMLMYSPEIYGRTGVQTIKTTGESKIEPGKQLKSIFENPSQIKPGFNMPAIIILILSVVVIMLLRIAKSRANKSLPVEPPANA